MVEYFQFHFIFCLITVGQCKMAEEGKEEGP